MSEKPFKIGYFARVTPVSVSFDVDYTPAELISKARTGEIRSLFARVNVAAGNGWGGIDIDLNPDFVVAATPEELEDHVIDKMGRGN